MKFNRLLFIPLLFVSIIAFSQASDVYKINYGVSKTNYKAGDTIDFIITIKIADGWDLYSSEFPADGPIKFECILEKSKEYIMAGKIRAYKPFTHYDDTWEADIKIFEKIAQFRIPVIVKKSGKINLKGLIEGQLCKDSCIPIKENFSADLSILPFSDYIAADPSVYNHYKNQK